MSTQNKEKVSLSIIIPVYKQQKTIRADIESLVSSLNDLNVTYEIIPVIDGELDNSRAEAEKVADKHVHVIGYKTNHGKGYAVRYGFSHANGSVVGFMDAGGDLKPSSLPLMYNQFVFGNADAVIGSKRHPGSKVVYPFYRTVMSWVYQRVIFILFGLNVRDTQVGMKLYKRKLLEDVLPRLLVKEFAFDIEILAVAYHLGYRNISEAPVELDFTNVISSINYKKLAGVVMNMLKDTLAVFYRLRLKHYYDNANQRKWRYDPELNFRVNTG